ncbi:unnamed protein product [Cyprideis torosa]|uniref:Uncharacterized protein n=1 Tax=Cyprideis torosa TaxID=163714 RepID=A0A7R8ZK22_9CRUS|nr:unnamed protein product [Cyprideis torosa]CAG0879396.1 unnamed protein product [Cyprideis torosa]
MGVSMFLACQKLPQSLLLDVNTRETLKVKVTLSSKYLRGSSRSRLCAIVGLFLSIPVFLTGLILHTFLLFHSRSAVISAILLGLGIIFCACAIAHNVYLWQKFEKEFQMGSMHTRGDSMVSWPSIGFEQNPGQATASGLSLHSTSSSSNMSVPSSRTVSKTITEGAQLTLHQAIDAGESSRWESTGKGSQITGLTPGILDSSATSTPAHELSTLV